MVLETTKRWTRAEFNKLYRYWDKEALRLASEFGGIDKLRQRVVGREKGHPELHAALGRTPYNDDPCCRCGTVHLVKITTGEWLCNKCIEDVHDYHWGDYAGLDCRRGREPDGRSGLR